MLTTKNWRAVLLSRVLVLATALTLIGCTPAGPRALLDGERLLREGKPAEAIVKLQVATQLLPSNAQAWNHLGLAYHKAGQPSAALKAYEQARRCDLNLTPVRFNLGCLLLEQNNPQAAVGELTAYTLLQSDSPDGWLKLGIAQLRSRQLEPAERSLQHALRLHANSPEAWNALGVVQAQRRRPKEAFNSFALALQKHPGYGPATLNLAVLYHHHLNNRPLALKTYEAYLGTAGTRHEAAAVQDIIRNLRAELMAPPPRPEATNLVASPPGGGLASSNTVPAPRPGTQIAAAPRVPPSVSSPTLPTGPAVAERPPTPLTNTVASADPSPDSRRGTEPIRRDPERAATNQGLSPPGIVQAPPRLPEGSRTEPPPKVEVVEIPEEFQLKPAQDQAASGSELARPSQAEAPADPWVQAPRRVEDTRERRRMTDRLNPTTWFRGDRRPGTTPTPLEPSAEVRRGTRESTTAVAARPQTVNSQPAPVVVWGRRYTYQRPRQPVPGDRRKAERYFAQAVQAHRDRQLATAIEDYRQAAGLDPAFFEAHYNLGLAAYELKDLPQSLAAYETALSINDTSANARYNFALALEKGSYFEDAANELEKLIEQHPGETRAHLSVASLYAQQLGKLEQARSHYRQVLHLEPQHAQAGAIRYWLAANP